MKPTEMPSLSRLQRFVVAHHESRPLMAATTVLAPRRLFRSFMRLTEQKPLGWLRGRGALTLSFDCDYSKDVEAYPYVVALLKRYRIRASFAVVGLWVERYPDLHKALLEDGHEIVNHTYSHPDNEEINPGRKFRLISREEKKEEVARAHEVIRQVMGVDCAGCRIPHFKDLFTPEIYGILAELGYRFDSSTLMTGSPTGGRPFRGPQGIWEFPLTTCPKHPLTVLDTWHSLHVGHPFYKWSHDTAQEFCALLWETAEAALAYGNYVNIYLDPWDLPQLAGFEALLARMAERRDELELLLYRDILERLEEQSPNAGGGA
ncbi:polysaccharide deacetylase family protein [bacterium]|nr:polysaccharide deacetylase family protein [bacterium]